MVRVSPKFEVSEDKSVEVENAVQRSIWVKDIDFAVGLFVEAKGASSDQSSQVQEEQRLRARANNFLH
jgi:hypothetical protein